MRILLLQQEMGRRQKEKPVFPLGLASLASVLIKKHKVKVFDPNIFPSPCEASKRLAQIMADFSPDVVGISIKYIETIEKSDTYVYYKNIRNMLGEVKAINPKSVVIAGGAGFSIFAKEIMRDLPSLDFGVYLEGEDSLFELLDNLDNPENVRGIFIRRGGEPFFTGSRQLPDFEKLDMFSLNPEVLDISRYICDDYQVFGIQSKRGCAHECAYCSYPQLNGRLLRLKDPVKLVDEIEFLAKEYGLRTFSFADNIFNVPQEHAYQICSEILKRKLRVKWGAWFDLKNFSQELLALAVSSGCSYVEFSPDAATEKGLKLLGKGITLSDIDRSISIIRNEKRIIVSYNFFCIHPAQTFFGMIRSLFLFAKIFLFLFGRVRISLAWIRIMPQTLMQQIAIKEGLIKEQEGLLAVNEDKLRHFLYSKASLRLLDILCTYSVIIADRCLKPVLKNIFKVTGKFYPFYYS
ncbi:MAG: cobalamin-dependent protein [Candidatus Omnitrophica bacterium]|nr:cobalamin-dependent protein [Candidatus Omnitrophota bacterium]